MGLYNPEAVRQFYNGYGEREWNRFEGPFGQVKAHVTHRFLERHVASGLRVLDAGAGPGRFAIGLARRGCAVTLVDVSEAMLAEAERRLAAEGLGGQVEGVHRCSYLDLGFMESGRFDAVVCIGGSLNYMPERVPQALAELGRVLRPGGVLVGGVMCAMGSLRDVLVGGWKPADDGLDGPALLQVFRTGVLEVDGRPISEHRARMFSLAEVQGFLARGRLELVEASATDCLLRLPQEQLQELQRDPAWEALLQAEVEACVRTPEVGGHLLIAARLAGSGGGQTEP